MRFATNNLARANANLRRTRVVGFAAVLLGIAVLVGWYFDSLFLVRLNPGCACMPLASAVGFVCCGLGLLAASLGRRSLTFIFSICPMVLALGIWGEYLSGFDFLDDLSDFAKSELVNACSGGRNAASTGISFGMASIVLFILSRRLRSQANAIWLSLFGALILGLALITISAYAFNLQDIRGLMNLTSMPLNTSLGFALFGLEALFQSWIADRRLHSSTLSWLPIPITLIFVLTILLFAQALAFNQKASVERLVRAELISGVSNEISACLEGRASMMSRMISLLPPDRFWPTPTLKTELSRLFAKDAGLENVYWANRNGKIFWSFSRFGEARRIRSNRRLEKQARQLAAKAQKAPDANAFGGAVDVGLDQNKILQVTTPWRDNQNRGWLISSYAVGSFFADVLDPNLSAGYAIEIWNNGQLTFARDTSDRSFEKEWAQQIIVPAHGNQWDVRIWPTSKIMTLITSPAATISLFSGLIVACLGAVTMYFAQRAQVRVVQAEEANQKLNKEVKTRITAEQQLRATHSELEKKRVSLTIQARELERSNVELEHFAYVASHDLQEPLRMISSFLTLISHRYQGKLDQTADEFINFAIDGANRMKQLIDDLLAFSRVKGGNRNFEVVCLEKVLREVLSNLKVAIEETGANIESETLPDIYGNRLQMVLLFQNLIANALKFRSAQTPHIRIKVEEIGQSLQFKLSDNGIGIEMENAHRIFLIFQRLHTREQYPGTGMGLAICKKIVENHHGQIGVESRSGQGSVFYFSLPRPQKTENANQPTQILSAPQA